MSITKSIASTIFLIASLFAHDADAKSSDRALGRVVAVNGANIEMRFSDGSAAVGDVYEVHRRRNVAPKSAASARFVHVAEVRVSELLGHGHVRAVVVSGSPWRRDRASASMRDDATSRN